jgi:hypothetical protein
MLSYEQYLDVTSTGCIDHKHSTCPVQSNRYPNELPALSPSCYFIFINKSFNQKFSNSRSYVITHSSWYYTDLWDDQWPCALRLGSGAARLLGLRVRIPQGSEMFVSCKCCALSGRGLFTGPITSPEESYREWCVVVRDLETSRMRRPWPALGRSATRKKSLESLPPQQIRASRKLPNYKYDLGVLCPRAWQVSWKSFNWFESWSGGGGGGLQELGSHVDAMQVACPLPCSSNSGERCIKTSRQ